MKRLLWLDIAKGLAILWVVYFHFFRTYFEHGELPPPDWSNLAASATSILGIVWLQISGLGFHAVGVFIILSGWALMESTARRADSRGLTWGTWYRSRFLRLYPMYWVAHLVYLVSPFVVRPEQVDGRIVLSLLGLRFIDIEMNFYYLNPAWWYFTMLIQFYLLFPLLFWAARKLGPWTFLLAACAVGFFVRYLMLVVYPQNGMWTQGGFAICRLPEFALGMALGMWHSRSTARAERFFLGGAGLVAGVAPLSRGAPALQQRLSLTFSSISPPARAAFLKLSASPESLRASRARPKCSASSAPSPTVCISFINPMSSGWACASGNNRSGCSCLSRSPR